MPKGIAEGISRVRSRIRAAAEACGRDADEVRLIAVSKTQPAACIREAHAAGQRDFGENYIQELEAKALELSDLTELRFHAIGHLQRNKVSRALHVAGTLHSVDSLKLVRELELRASAIPTAERPAGVTEAGQYRVLIEVNVGGETQKTGCPRAELGGLLDAVDACSSLVLTGLMTVPPHTEDPAGAEPHFRQLVELRERHGGSARLPELSMGMTHDLEVAIASGATWVRVGTAIFGERTRSAE